MVTKDPMKPTKNLGYGFLIILFFAVIGHSTVLGESRELTLAVGLTIPPYNIPETNSGIELDIVREALKAKGYSIKPKYVPFARRNLELSNREADGVLTINTDSGIDKKIRDAFNEGLKELRRTGRYNEIVKKYLSQKQGTGE